MVRLDPTGGRASAYVFGDAIGQRVNFRRKLWETPVLKAHGHNPTWTRTKALTAESRDALRCLDVTFHDLRHEAGSRLLEQGWPLHHIQAMLGHANLSQTSTYLNATKTGLHDSMKRFGGTSLHAVAPESPREYPPRSNTGKDDSPQVTVN